MYQKIICKNGEVILTSDMGAIISKVNDLNLIDLANLDNELEEVQNQKSFFSNRMESCRKNFNIFNRLKLILIIVSVLMLLSSIVLNISICSICSILSLLTSICCNLYNKVLSNEITNDQLLIDFLNNYQEKKINERKTLTLNPTFSVIREGQEFDITKPVGLSNGIKVLHAYYKYKDLIHRSFVKSDCTREYIANNFLIVFKDCDVDDAHRDMIIDEVYNNINKEKILIKK